VISGHWRALTRKQMRPSVDTWKGRILQTLESICDVANWDLPDKSISLAFWQRVEVIFKVAEEIRVATGERATCVDLSLTGTKKDHIFRPEYVEDAYGDVGISGHDTKELSPSTEIALAAVGLGVQRVSKARLPNGGVKIERYCEKRPKVVLLSTVLQALDSPPRT